MFLKSLSILHGEKTIRNIIFHKGINLIIDETDTSNKKISGNNVGKTTVIRLIDFCLGGDGKNIYVDPEFTNKENKTVKSYLLDNNILIKLILKENLEVVDSKEIIIERNFLSYSDKIVRINGENIKAGDFSEALKSKIFKFSGKKPTFRQIISKNIRDEKQKLTNTLKVLFPKTKDIIYESLYLFWLGIRVDDFEQKIALDDQRTIERNFQSRLKKESTHSQTEQALILVNREIEELEDKKKNSNYSDAYMNHLKNINELNIKINETSTQITRLTLRKELIDESIKELNSEVSKIDVSKIKTLYNEAKKLMPNLQKTFEETLSFHNGMIEEKRKFIEADLPDINTNLNKHEENLSSYIEQKNKHLDEIDSYCDVTELNDLNVKINQLYESKGKLEEHKNLWEKSEEKLGAIEEKLKEIDKKIQALDGVIKERITVFNEYFSKNTDALYGEKYLLSADYDEKKEIYKLDITSLSGNPGTGRKKGEMAAFDLSYIQFADRLEIPCLHFILQDQIENVHDNQITNIFKNLVSKINCQYVLPTLKDKLPDFIDIEDLSIITLSQANKLFKV